MLEIRLLGQFEIRRDGASVEIPWRSAQSLLAFLVLNTGMAQRRERLAGLLWPDSSEANARRNLRQALWQIRRALSDTSSRWLLADEITITFNAQADVWLDTGLVERAIAVRPVVDNLILDVTAYGGDLLPGFYEEWVVRERERLHAQFERKMSLLLEQLVEAARWADVLHWAERWIALGSTPEPAYRALMQAHAGLGDTSSVAQVYRRCAEALARDLDVEPSAQTQALYERLRLGESPAPAAASSAPPLNHSPQHNLPVQLTSFIGRQREIGEIQRLLTAHRLVTLTGPGGSGKTRLALRVAQTIVDCGLQIADLPQRDPASQPNHQTSNINHQFADGVWLVELATLTDAELVPQAVAVVLGVREEPDYPLVRALTEYLRTQSLLLILDNCEHLVETCAQLATDLLRAAPNLRILATSRETLGVTGEVVLHVPSLALPDVDQLPPLAELAQYEATCLFLDRATVVRPEFRLTAANAGAIAQICYQLDGMPLAIELAAARVRAMTPEQIATRLADALGARFQLLIGGSRTALPHQQTLRATIDWSWELLTEDERTLLRRLAVFAGGWTLEAAEAVCADFGFEISDFGLPVDVLSLQNPKSRIQNSEVLELLTHLVEKSFVVVEEQAGAARYSLLETIRQYAGEKLVASGESAAVSLHHLQFFRKLAQTVEPKLRAGEQLVWLARLDLEHDNLRSALKWATHNGALEAGLRLAANLARFWYLRGYWKEGRAWLKLLLSQAGSSSALTEEQTQARAQALYGAGWLADEDGSEIALYTESLALCRQVGDKWGIAFCLRGLASVTSNSSDLEQWDVRLQESLALFSELQDDWGIALVRFNLGWLALYRNKNAQARAHWEEGLTLFRRCGDRWGLAVTFNALGYVARLLGKETQAAEMIKASLASFRELGDQAGIAFSLTNLGGLAFRRGDYREASRFLHESLTLQQEQGVPQAMLTTLQLLGLVACYQGDFPRGQAAFAESMTLARERGIRSHVSNGLSYQAFVAYWQGDIEQAALLFQTSLARFQEDDDREGIAYVLHGQGLIALRQENYAQAHDQLQQSLTLWQTWDDKRSIAAVEDSLGQLAQAQGDHAAALVHFRTSLHLRQNMADKQGMAESCEHIAGASAADPVAVQLFAAAQMLRQAMDAPVLPVARALYEQQVNALCARLGEERFAAAWSQGTTLLLEQAVALALEE